MATSKRIHGAKIVDRWQMQTGNGLSIPVPVYMRRPGEGRGDKTTFFVLMEEPAIDVTSPSMDVLRESVKVTLQAITAVKWKPVILVKVEIVGRLRGHRTDDGFMLEMSWEQIEVDEGLTMHRPRGRQEITRNHPARVASWERGVKKVLLPNEPRVMRWLKDLQQRFTQAQVDLTKALRAMVVAAGGL